MGQSGKLAPGAGHRDTRRQQKRQGSEICNTYSASSRLPQIKVLIHERETAALIDPAATENLIHPSHLPEDQAITPSKKQLNLAAEGAQLSTSGECFLPITIRGKEFTVKFLITPELRHPLVLGLPWLEEEQGILDLTRHVLYLGRNIRMTVPLIQALQQHKKTAVFDAAVVQYGLTSPHRKALLALLQTYAEVFSPLCQGLP